MAEWTIFASLGDILINYYFGSHLSVSVALIVAMMLIFMVAGAPLRYALLFILPMTGGLALGGWFGVEGWILNGLLITIGLIYGFVVISLFSK